MRKSKRTRRRMRKPKHFQSWQAWELGWGAFILLTLVAVTLIGGIYRVSLYWSYQPAHCLIFDAKIKTRHLKTKGGEYDEYVPDFSYTLTTNTGQQVDGYEYARPNTMTFTERSKAQALLDHYQVGQTYPCWYSARAQEHAVLVLQGDSPSDVSSRLFVVWVGGTILLVLIASLCIKGIYRPWLLVIRGIVTRGKVVAYQGEGKNQHSLVVFRTLEQKPKQCRTKGSRWLALASTVPVMYDPRDPYGSGRVGKRLTTLLGCLVACLFVLCLAGSTMLLFTVMWISA